ncbi:MAG: hypothetical protein OXU73_01475 [Candidatus Campbellbacteria bacterium]|nr:hypothetical protein [Candidatus Campbellbacteria bacterium]
MEENLKSISRKVIALAATIASLCLLIQVAFPFPLRTIELSELASKLPELERYYIIDTIYTITWLVAWIGIIAILKARSRVVATVAGILTFIGMLFGLVKNEWTNAIANAQSIDVTAWWFLFKAIGNLSFLLVPTGIIFASIVLLGNKSKLAKVAGVLGLTFVFPLGFGMYMQSLFLFILLWGLLWTLVVTALLWVWAINPSKIEEQ